MKVCFLTASEVYYNKSRKDKYPSLDKDLFIQKPIENEVVYYKSTVIVYLRIAIM
jgi:hypothetical protein